MSNFSYFLPFLAYFLTQCSHVQLILDKKMLTTKMFVFWPNATVPFYVYPDHFDYEQSMAILSALADFNFKTCINFYPVLTAPKDGQHVLTFVNPNGIRRCKIKTVGHSNHFPHLVELGYDCIRSPLIEMMIMRALGLPFEHNRMSRTVYIDVLLQNVEPDAIELFTMDGVLPPVLRGLPYDINSVMHFEERDFSKNGHRTIIFKNPKMHQNRVGLTANDLRKIELVYGSECRTRDRQEKLEMCQAYPGLTRRKRDLKPNANRNLRVNRNITPPPSLLANSEEEKTQVEYNTTDAKTDDLHISLNALGIANETEYIKEQVFRVSALALENARQKYCNVTANLSNVVKPVLNPERKKGSPTDILGVIEVVADYAQSLVDHAVKNLTTFCENSKSIEEYQQLCELSDKSRCPESYRSRTASPKTRRRRDVSAMATEDEDDRDKTVIDADSAKSERGHKKKAGKYKTDHKKPRRFLKDIQYRTANNKILNKTQLNLQPEIDTENKFKADEEERETEVEEDKEEFVKEAINDGLDSMLAGNNDEENDEKTASEEDGIDAEGKDTDVIDEVESQKETEEVDKEEGLDVAKSEEQSAKEVEEEEEIATMT
ncbi:hypothetical protein HF086_006345 [Spodoptera exigua]|uniref:Metalloendopeptidase n=1 Tax=Spodoptera exigua TaxID=7107 RepID=A0A922MPG8_SPOEX|nr:hypothetical protein HF086_006345 [Spodoptera exigua]